MALPMLAGFLFAFVLVLGTTGPCKTRSARALIRIAHARTFCAVPTRLRCAVILFLAMLPGKSWCAAALVRLQRRQRASAPVHARPPIAAVRDRDLAERCAKPERTTTFEARRTARADLHLARATVLAARAGTLARVTGVEVLAVLADILRCTIAKTFSFQRRR